MVSTLVRSSLICLLALVCVGLLGTSAAAAKCRPPLICPKKEVKKPRKAKACPNGKVRSVDTRGKCCWPGQMYSLRKKKCMGTPERCPKSMDLKGDACVKSWGYNDDGISTPKPGVYVQVSAGHSHTCGLKKDGSVRCWGDNSRGQSTPPQGLRLKVP